MLKVSKIFHWLYAIVLLLPVFSIGAKVLYTTFNPNAKDSYYGETINDVSYESIGNDALMVGSRYHWYSNNIVDGPNILKSMYVRDFIFLEYTGNNQPNISVLPNIVRLNYYDDSDVRFFAYDTNNTLLATFILTGNILQFDFTFVSFENYNLYTLVKPYIYNLEYNDYSYVDNSFYYAVNQINEQPIFAWAQDSFLVEPIAYVSELFGLSNTSPLITLLSYWLNISIIWLCFDIVMYVPLMAHRWLDKGGIE